MKKEKIVKIALLGLANGLLISAAPAAETTTATTTKKTEAVDPNSENLGYHLMTEDELLLELNDAGTKMYNSLSPEGKKLAREVASARCNGSNECKGLNACEGPNNTCAGNGACKGQSKCAVSDKNLAVRLVAKKLGEKRSQAAQEFNKQNHR